MRRNWWFRSLGVALAAWLPLIAGEPGFLDPCPMHGAAVAAHAAAASSHHATHGGSAHGVMEQGGNGTNHLPPAQHHHCTCITCCSVSAALKAPAPMLQIAFVEYETASAVPNVESLARPAPEYSRPYTTGPPRA